ncbi:MAG: PASTA domain-containing protein [Duncaniella sp.]|nr:PASTA domain-containing protein [Duncaniella sp.]
MKRLLINICAMAAVVLLVGWMCMLWLGGWTRHGEVTVVPEVKSLNFEEAARRLASADLQAHLLDSVYDSHLPAGAVINQNPRAGAKVKPGRTVYVTINAFTPRMVTIPSLSDNSVRQARTTLNGLGITRITERRVPSDYHDLVLGVIYKGKRLSPGARVPVDATIELEIGQGLADVADSGDEAPEDGEELDLM